MLAGRIRYLTLVFFIFSVVSLWKITDYNQTLRRVYIAKKVIPAHTQLSQENFDEHVEEMPLPAKFLERCEALLSNQFNRERILAQKFAFARLKGDFITKEVFGDRLELPSEIEIERLRENL